MYIGPWQEYRLAKIQDDAIQRIRQEWEDNIRAQLPDGDDARIRELMQPLMAKLPALLMAKKPSERTNATTTAPGLRRARRPPGAAQSSQSTRPSTAMSIASSTRSRADRAESGKSRDGQSNQETHEDEPASAVASHPRRAISRQVSTKKTKKKSGPATALEEVARRRKMFAKWMKSEQDNPPPPAAARMSEAPAPESQAADASTRLPPIHTNTPTRPAASEPQPAAPESDALRLPLLYHNASAEPESIFPCEEPNLEDSLDEDEVNQLLNWTDNLLSPNALEASLAGLEADLDDVG